MNYLGKADREIRDGKIVEMRAEGKSCAHIGRQFGLTRERVRQIYEERLHMTECRQRLERAVETGAVLGVHVDDLGLTAHAAKCLKKDNVLRVGDLVRKSEADLLRFPNLGRKSLNKIKHVLSGMGLGLRRGSGGPAAGER